VLADPAPVIQAAALGNFAISIAVKPWVNVPDFEAATGEVNSSIVREFRSRGIVIPSLTALQSSVFHDERK
jgi:small-conductance mechanosensitive channel